MYGRGWKERLLDVVMPRACAACGRDLPPPFTGPACGDCMARMRPDRRPAGPEPGALRLIAAAFAYRHPVPRLLHAFKYDADAGVGRALADWMAGRWISVPELGIPDLLVPVPLHPARQRRRGFNQAERLARPLSRCIRTPVLEALRRRRGGKPQARTPRKARRGRLAGAFEALPRRELAGAHVVLIDDVCTSGETLRECAKALDRAGASDIRAFVLARG